MKFRDGAAAAAASYSAANAVANVVVDNNADADAP
jgi:hypothetical protein